MVVEEGKYKPKQCYFRDTVWQKRHNFQGSCFPR